MGSSYQTTWGFTGESTARGTELPLSSAPSSRNCSLSNQWPSSCVTSADVDLAGNQLKNLPFSATFSRGDCLAVTGRVRARLWCSRAATIPDPPSSGLRPSSPPGAKGRYPGLTCGCACGAREPESRNTKRRKRGIVASDVIQSPQTSLVMTMPVTTKLDASLALRPALSVLPRALSRGAAGASVATRNLAVLVGEASHKASLVHRGRLPRGRPSRAPNAPAPFSPSARLRHGTGRPGADECARRGGPGRE